MLKKLLITLFTIISSVKLAFAAQGNFLTKPFVDLFGSEGISYLLKNEAVVAGLLYVAYLLGFFNILKVGLSYAGFKSDHTKERNTIAMMISFIGVTGMFFIFRESPEQMIVLFGGSVGFFLLCLIGISFINLIRNVSKGDDNETLTKWGMVRVLLATIFVFFMLSIYVEKAMHDLIKNDGVWTVIYNFLVAATGYLIIGTIIYGLVTLGKRSQKKYEDEIVNESPEVIEAHNHISNIQKNLKEVNSTMKKIKGRLRV